MHEAEALTVQHHNQSWAGDNRLTSRQQQRKKEKDELHQDAFIAFFNVAGANS